MKRPLIQVFIATYNRPTLVLNAIRSALNQNFDSFEVIVSDNSTNDETEILLAKITDKRFSYKRRKPSLLPIEHLNTILKDVTAEYFMIFHDDDVMHSEMVGTLYNKLIKDEKAVAIGSNARVVKKGKYKKKKFYKKLKTDITITNRDQIAKGYLTDHLVPFPSYLYRRVVAQQLCLDIEHGGKYSDAAFIMDLLSLGHVIHCASALLDYYKHSGQDSSLNAFYDRIKLVNYITKTTNYTSSNPLVKKYRINNIYAELKRDLLNKNISIFSKKYCRKLSLIFKLSPFEYFNKSILITLFSLFLKRTIKD